MYYLLVNIRNFSSVLLVILFLLAFLIAVPLAQETPQSPLYGFFVFLVIGLGLTGIARLLSDVLAVVAATVSGIVFVVLAFMFQDLWPVKLFWLYLGTGILLIISMVKIPPEPEGL